MLHRIGLLLVAGLLYSLTSPLVAQTEDDKGTAPETELDRVKAISAMTGRPIFAVAGQST